MSSKQVYTFLLCISYPFHILFGQQNGNRISCSDSLATRGNKTLYKNLYHLIGKNTLLGHQDDPCYGVGWKYENGRSDIRDITGQYPALYGFDLGRIELGLSYNLDSVPFEKTRLFIREAYERGGVITLSWHLNNPLTGKTAWDNKPGAVASILPGGEKNAIYTTWLDHVAEFLNSLKAKNGEQIPVILRLFHELNGGWFWWGKDQCTPDEMKQLWRYTIHYIRNVKQIHHLLYAFNTDKFNSGAEFTERYPGDEFIDILGFDIYQAGAIQKNEIFIPFFNRELDMIDSIALAHNKIPALTEFGYNQIPDSNWWTKVFYPAVASHKVVYALAWRNADMKQYFVPYPRSSSADDFKNMSAAGKILFESGIKTKKYLSMNTIPTRLLFVLLLNLIFFSGFAQKELYELRIYKMKTAEQIKATDNYLENAYLPALHRIGIKQIGVFKPISNDTSALKVIIVIVPYISLDVWHRTSSVLASDQVYTDNAKAFMDADTNSYPYLRMESTLMEAFPDQMKLIPTTLKMTPGAVYEMRSYESPSEELHRVKVDMFNDGGEITLFKRLDFQSVFYADVISGSHMPNLIYMVVFENAAAREAHWKTFGDSKEWKMISSDPKYRNKISVSHIDSILMHRTSYSDL